MDIVTSDPVNIYAILKDFQIAISGLLGFAGVIVTLAVNSYIQRKASRADKRHEADALKALILSEIRLMKSAFIESSNSLSNNNGEEFDVLFPIYPLNRMFLARISDLGLLDENDLETIVKIYATYETFSTSLKLLGVTPPNQPDYIELKDHNITAVGNMASNLLEQVEAALKNLEK